MAFVLSFAFGTTLAALMPVLPFLAIVALLSVVSVVISVAHEGPLLTPMLRVSGEVVCAQLGYITGLVGRALLARKKASTTLRPGQTERQDTEGGGV